jgi:hypothetical protein
MERESIADAYENTAHVTPGTTQFVKFSSGDVWRIAENKKDLVVMDVLEEKESLTFDLVFWKPKGESTNRISLSPADGVLRFASGAAWKITETENSYDVSEITHEDVEGKTQIVLKPLFSKQK